MIRPRAFPPTIEPLESRIAPAALITHPFSDISSGSVVDLSHLIDPGLARTQVSFTTNFDTNPNQSGVQAGVIVIELYDDLAPFSVANFLSYVNTLNVRGDYDGTFLHRMADFGADSGAGNDIIQGGGFETGAIHTHIPTAAPIVNEYRGDLPNARGTIAMARTEAVDSATSEWFFNVTDNTTTLGPANTGGGSYAVFAHVLSGLDVLDKIALLGTANLGGAISTAPVQNVPAGKTATVANLITLTDVKVIPGPKADTTGITFETVSITDAATHQPTDLLTATVAGSDLNLAYAAGKLGVATVKVRATQNGMSVEDEFDVTVKPNLSASITNDGLANLIMPGAASPVSVRISNNGLAAAATNVDVKFFLSKVVGAQTDPSYEPDGAKLDAGDVLISEFKDQPINLAGGASVLLTKTLDLSRLLGTNASESYKLIAQVTPSAGSALDEAFTTDNSSIDGHLHQAANFVGTFLDADNVLHKNVVLTYTEADGDLVTLSVKGVGFAEVTTTGGLIDLHANGTNAATVLNAKTAVGKHIELHDLLVTSQVGSVALGQVNFSGSIAFSGGAKSIVLGDVNSDSHLTIGGFAPANTQAVAIKLGNVQDVRLDSFMPIGSLTALEWLDTKGDHDAISAVSLGSLKITGGNLEADVFTSGSTRLASIAVSGLVKNSTLKINGALGTLTAAGLDHANLTALGGVTSIVTGDISDSSVTLGGSAILAKFAAGNVKNTTIHTGGDVRSAIVGGFDHSEFFAGAQTLPTSLGSLGSHAIGSLTIRGAFTDSQVAAARLGTVQLQSATAPTGGFIADAIKTYNRAGTPILRNLGAPGTFDTLTGYKVSVF